MQTGGGIAAYELPRHVSPVITFKTRNSSEYELCTRREFEIYAYYREKKELKGILTHTETPHTSLQCEKPVQINLRLLEYPDLILVPQAFNAAELQVSARSYAGGGGVGDGNILLWFPLPDAFFFEAATRMRIEFVLMVVLFTCGVFCVAYYEAFTVFLNVIGSQSSVMFFYVLLPICIIFIGCGAWLGGLGTVLISVYALRSRRDSGQSWGGLLPLISLFVSLCETSYMLSVLGPVRAEFASTGYVEPAPVSRLEL